MRSRTKCIRPEKQNDGTMGPQSEMLLFELLGWRRYRR